MGQISNNDKMRSPVLTTAGKWFDTFTLFLNSDLSPPREYPIVLGQYFDLSNPFIFYNTEQLSRAGAPEIFIPVSQNPNCKEVWDYSKANVDIWKKFGINAIHVPPVVPDHFLEKLKEYRKAGQIYDVGFSGHTNERRLNIRDRLNQLGYNTHFLYETFGEERDIELAKCKILLNIHAADDYQIFESLRCEPWLAIGVPIISEHSLDNDPRCINVSYDKIVDAVVKQLPRD